MRIYGGFSYDAKIFNARLTFLTDNAPDFNEGRLVCNMPENKSSPPNDRTGVVSIIKVLQHFGVKDLQKIYDQNPETDNQLDWKKLQKLAKKYNISSTLIRPTVEELREIEYPALAKMNDGAYIALGSANDEVVLAIDPRQNKPLAIPIKDFLEAWSNELLIFSAALSWTYFKKRYNVDWFLRVLKRYKKPLGEVLAASFFLQLMGIGFPLITQVIIDKVIGNNGISTLTVIGCSMIVFFFMQALLTALKTYILNRDFGHATVPPPDFPAVAVLRKAARRRYLDACRGFGTNSRLLDGFGTHDGFGRVLLRRVYRVHVLVFRAADVNRADNNPAVPGAKYLGSADYQAQD